MYTRVNLIPAYQIFLPERGVKIQAVFRYSVEDSTLVYSTPTETNLEASVTLFLKLYYA